MSSRAQDVYFDVANQRLVFDAPEGRPTSVHPVSVFSVGAGDEGTAQSATSGSPSIDLVSTTVDAASGNGEVNPRILYVAATTNMAVGRSYLVTSADGAKEWIEVVEIDAGNYVKTRYPMANTYASADTVVSTRITIPLSTTWVEDQNKLTGGRDPGNGYRVRWVYDVAGTQYVHDSYFDLVRYAGGHTLIASDIESMYPGFKGMLASYHKQDDGKRLVDEAYEQVKWDLHDVDLDDSAVMDQDALNRATLLRLGVLLAKARMLQGQTDPVVVEMAERDYNGFVNKTFRSGAKVAVAVDSSGAAAKVSARNVWGPR